MSGRMMSIMLKGVGAMLLVAFSLGCGSERSTPVASHDTVTQQPGAALGNLPTPDAALLRMSKAAGDPVYGRFGREYDAALGQHVKAEGDCVRFSPDWSVNADGVVGLAYGVFAFNLTDYAGASSFSLAWADAPGNLSNVWLGLSDWEHDKWKWFACPASGVLDLPDPPGLAPYTKAGTGEMLAVFVMTGQEPGVLHQCGVQFAAVSDSWPMYQHDAQHTGRSLHIGPATNALKWKFADPRAPGHYLDNPAVGPEGHVYAVGTDSFMYAFNADGSLAWKTPDCSHNTPVVAPDGTVYGVSNDGVIKAFNADGSLKWSYQAYPPEYSPALAADGTLIFAAGNVYALNPDGTLKWTTSMPDTGGFGPPACGPEGVVYAVGSSSLYPFTANLYALNADGTLRWIFTDPNGKQIIKYRPAVDTDGTTYIISNSEYLMAVNPDGTLKWQATETFGYTSILTIGPDHTLYIVRSPIFPEVNYSLNAIDNLTGATKWQVLTDDEVHSELLVNSDGAIIFGEGYRYDNSDANYHHLHAVAPDGSPLWTTEVRGAVLPQLAKDSSGNIYCTVIHLPVINYYSHCRLYALDHLGAVLWTSGTGEGIPSGSAVVGVDGRVYGAYDNGNTYAFTPDGMLDWKYESDGGDLWGSPAVLDDGTLYMPSVDNNFYSINDGGTLKWKYTGPYSVLESSPTVGPDDTVYIGDFGQTPTGNPNYNDDGVFYALNADGTLKWSHMFACSFRSSAAISKDGTVYVASIAGDLHAFDGDGNILWDSPNGTTYGENSVSIGADGTLYAGGSTENLNAINPNGTLKWSLALGATVLSAPALAVDGTVYVCGNDEVLRAVNPDGTLAWSYTAGVAIYTSPMVDGAGRIYFGSLDHNLYALNPDGTLLWTFATGDQILTSPVIGNDGTIYIGSDDGYLYAIGPGVS